MQETAHFIGECDLDEDGFSSSEFEDERMDTYDEFLALAEWTIKGLKEGELNIPDSLAGIAGYLMPKGSDGNSMDIPSVVADGSLNLDNSCADSLEKQLILAGFHDCMNEAIRYLVEEESISTQDPMVTSLREHLLTREEHLEFDILVGKNDYSNELVNRQLRVDSIRSIHHSSSAAISSRERTLDDSVAPPLLTLVNSWDQDKTSPSV